MGVDCLGGGDWEAEMSCSLAALLAGDLGGVLGGGVGDLGPLVGDPSVVGAGSGFPCGCCGDRSLVFCFLAGVAGGVDRGFRLLFPGVSGWLVTTSAYVGGLVGGFLLGVGVGLAGSGLIFSLSRMRRVENLSLPMMVLPLELVQVDPQKE